MTRVCPPSTAVWFAHAVKGVLFVAQFGESKIAPFE